MRSPITPPLRPLIKWEPVLSLPIPLRLLLAAQTAWRDGTMHLVMSPLEFMQRLAALVSRQRLHLIRFGVRITSLREVGSKPQSCGTQADLVLSAFALIAPSYAVFPLVGGTQAQRPFADQLCNGDLAFAGDFHDSYLQK